MAAKTDSPAVNGRLFDRAQEMNRQLMERFQAVQKTEAEYGGRLLQAKNPAEATAICNEWMAKRLETFAADQKVFTTAWADMISDIVQSSTAVTAQMLNRGKQESARVSS